MVRFISVVIRYRLLVVAILAGITVLAGLSISRGSFGTSLGRLFFGDSEEFETYVARTREFATDEVVVFVLKDLDLTDLDTLERIEAAKGAMESEAFVQRVTTVCDLQKMTLRAGTVHASRFVEAARDGPEDVGALLETYVDDPLGAGVLVSQNRRHTTVLVELHADPERRSEVLPSFVDGLASHLVAQGFPAERTHRTGFVVVIAEVTIQAGRSLTLLLPIVSLVLFFVTWVLFRRLWPVLIAGFVTALAAVWTMGLAIAIDPEINVMMSIVPMVVMIVGFSDVIHLCSAYLLELAGGRAKDDAILTSASEVGTACFWTSLTTFVGFVSISFIPTPVFRVLGITLGSGVAVALFIAVTLCPVLFTWMDTPKAWRGAGTSRVQGGMDAVIAGCGALATRHPRWVVAVFLAVLVVSGAIGSRLQVDARMSERLTSENRVRVAQRFFEAHFTDNNLLDVFVTVPEKTGHFDPTIYRDLARLQERVKALDGVTDVLAWNDLVDLVHGALYADEASVPPVPTSRAALAQYALLFEMSDGEGLAQLLDFDRQVARLAVRVETEGFRAAHDTGHAMKALGAEIFGERATVESAGILVLLGGWLGEILTGQRRGLGFTLLMIWFMMTVALRSVRLGALSMIPNVFPLFVLGGVLVSMYDMVDSDCLILAMFAIGIGVDDTVHFMVRFRIERRRTSDRVVAIQRTFHYAGRAILITTATLTLGFFPLSFSSYTTIALMGTLLPMTLILALLADLVLVPAMAELGWLEVRGSSARA